MSLYWHTCGEGKTDLVLLHGWGLNAEVWRPVTDQLSAHFRLHLVDLPGYGRSQGFPAQTLDQMVATLLPLIPKNALVIGWSLGGLVAIRLAQQAAGAIRGLLTVASSPCFTEQQNWAGIKMSVLETFRQQLSHHFVKTIDRFMALQTLGTETARQDTRLLREAILSQPLPDVAVLNAGLGILQTTDLRPELSSLTLPWLRIYGALDGLVPRTIASEVDRLAGQGSSVVISRAGHAPFISHPEEFCHEVINFLRFC